MSTSLAARSIYRPIFDTLGPEHAGMRMTLPEFWEADAVEGYRFELVAGVVEVFVPAPPYVADAIANIMATVRDWSSTNRQPHFARLHGRARVIVEYGPGAPSDLEPSLAAYLSWPQTAPHTYRGLNPALVVDVLNPEDVFQWQKARQEILHCQPALLEHWIVDPRRDLVRPSMTAYRRTIPNQPLEQTFVEDGGTYESLAWAGLRLDLSRVMIA